MKLFRFWQFMQLLDTVCSDFSTDVFSAASLQSLRASLNVVCNIVKDDGVKKVRVPSRAKDE